MASKIVFAFILYLFSQLGICQSEKWIHGQITVKDGSSQGVHIINLVNEKETVSNEKGEFNIEAKTDDLLVLSSNHLDYQRKIIDEDDFKSGSVTIEMTAKATQLNEVKVFKNSEFDPVKLGILSNPTKKYTVRERQLKTAAEFKPIMLVGFLFGQIPVDPILNAISGRTKMLKKELSAEREESLLTLLGELFDNDYYTKELKIEPDHIKGFQLYAIQNQNMKKALPSKNKAIISFIAVQLAFEYNRLQKDDNLTNSLSK